MLPIMRAVAAKERRAAQLRRAKRAQRARERARGLVPVQLVVERDTARRLRVAMRDRGFGEALERFLKDQVVRVADFPALADISWNVKEEYLPACIAFALYERNWRFVDERRLTAPERALIDHLAARFGGGIVHA